MFDEYLARRDWESPPHLPEDFPEEPNVIRKELEEEKVLCAFASHPNYEYRSVSGVARETKIHVDRVAQIVEKWAGKILLQHMRSPDHWGHQNRINDSGSQYHPMYKNGTKQMTVYQTRYLSDEQHEMIGEALGKAIRHTERVAMRNHIKADRIERVNLFVTSVRREISYLSKLTEDIRSWAVGILSEKYNWHDIGVPASTHSEIDRWLLIVKRTCHSASAQSDEILGDLEELERGLVGVQRQVREAERINVEGEKIVAGLCEVFQ